MALRVRYRALGTSNVRPTLELIAELQLFARDRCGLSEGLFRGVAGRLKSGCKRDKAEELLKRFPLYL